MKKRWKELVLPLVTVTTVLLLFALLYHVDNKYHTAPPYGKNGILTLDEQDLERDVPLYLIDGWQFSDKEVTMQETYIGKYPNLQRKNRTTPIHGSATYNLTFRYSGKAREVMLYFPHLFNRHVISLDSTVLSRKDGGGLISFLLTEGDHLLEVKTYSTQGFYSGMYHPPAFGKTETVFRNVVMQCVLYGIAFIAPLTLAIFNLTLWRSSKERIAFWFGLLCCTFSVYLSYYFVRLLSLPSSLYWFQVQAGALYLLCYTVVKLTAMCGGVQGKKSVVVVQKAVRTLAIFLFVLTFFVSSVPWMNMLHGFLTNCFYILTFCSVLLILFQSKAKGDWEKRFTQLGCTVFGLGLLLNLFSSNLFEPILFFWQFEWCGFTMVCLFGCMMAARNKRILAENRMFQVHLEEMVQQRTAELTNLLQERKAFFADMAHDLKAPIFATNAYIQAIRAGGTGVDNELLHYVDLVEQKQQEMARRVQGIAALNQMEEAVPQNTAVSVTKLLKEAYESHHMAAEVQSIYLLIELPETDGFLFAQPKKLEILLENLIYNALHATTSGGRILLAAELDEEGCHLSVADTGSGIPPEELPHLFERYFVGEKNKGTGSGLGLYIVKSIVEELSGEISVSSKPGQGATFYIDLPLMDQ